VHFAERVKGYFQKKIRGQGGKHARRENTSHDPAARLLIRKNAESPRGKGKIGSVTHSDRFSGSSP